MGEQVSHTYGGRTKIYLFFHQRGPVDWHREPGTLSSQGDLMPAILSHIGSTFFVLMSIFVGKNI